MLNLKTLHALADLATDAVEAIIHWWNSDRAADELWLSHADRLAKAEAEQEVWEPKPAHGDSGNATWANEHICTCGESYRTLPPYGTLPSFEQHVAKARSSVAAPQVSADSAATERPAPPSIRGDVEAPGTPRICINDPYVNSSDVPCPNCGVCLRVSTNYYFRK